MEIRLSKYSELAQWSKAFCDGAFGLFFLIGDPGHAKSYTMRAMIEEMAAKQKVERAKKALKAARDAQKPKKKGAKPPEDPTKHKDYQKKPDNHVAEPLWMKGGSVSAFKTYQELYTHLDELVIFDDVDSVYSDRGLVRLLKAVCETEEVKEVGWHTDSRQLEKLDIPLKFKTRSRVCIIANDWKNLSDHVNSLMSRGMKVEFRPDIDEVLNYVKKNKIITDKEVLKFIDDNKWMARKIDIRTIEGAVEAKRMKLPWQDALAMSMGIRDMMLVARLLDGKTHFTEVALQEEFMRLTGQSRPQWFKAKEALREARNRVLSDPKAKAGQKAKVEKIVAPKVPGAGKRKDVTGVQA